MGLKAIKIEHMFKKSNAGVHKDMKKQRRKKLRRTPIDKPVNTTRYTD